MRMPPSARTPPGPAAPPPSPLPTRAGVGASPAEVVLRRGARPGRVRRPVDRPLRRPRRARLLLVLHRHPHRGGLPLLGLGARRGRGARPLRRARAGRRHVRAGVAGGLQGVGQHGGGARLRRRRARRLHRQRGGARRAAPRPRPPRVTAADDAAAAAAAAAPAARHVHGRSHLWKLQQLHDARCAARPKAPRRPAPSVSPPPPPPPRCPPPPFLPAADATSVCRRVVLELCEGAHGGRRHRRRHVRQLAALRVGGRARLRHLRRGAG